MRAWAALAAAAMAMASLLSGALGEDTAVQGCDPSKWKAPVDGQYDTAGKIDPKKLNVHLIPHSHDDPGWLVGVDQYYMEKVQFILDTAVEELVRNPDRKFMFVEQSFFQRWWHEQGSKVKAIVKELVKEGRLDLTVNGAWSMHDEATPHYIAMVDQTAYGHKLLMEEFGISPRIGWQIDPFGHSATQGSLLSKGVGFDALYFARIDYQDYGRRMKNKEMEFIWRPSKSRGKESEVFTGEIIDHYCAPGPFDYGNIGNEIQDDTDLHDYDVCKEVDQFVQNAQMRGGNSKGNHVFIPMGCDFQFDNSRRWFKNMDKLVHYVNQDGRVNVLYSNLSYYTDLKKAEGLTWSVKTDDFLPYASDKHEYWSGFFTSRPALKRFARVANTVMQQVRQLDAVYQSHHATEMESLQRAVGLVQHHDGLSGTEKQSVAYDYALRLNDGIIEAEKEMNEVLFVIGEKEPYHFCLMANTSVCDVSTQNMDFEVLVHNSVPRTSVQTISIPITHKSAQVQVLTGDATVRHQDVYIALPVHEETQVAPYTLVFSVELKPLSSTRFSVKQLDAPDVDTTEKLEQFKEDESITLENDLVRVDIDKKTGSITTLTNKKKNIQMPLSLDVAYYQAFQKGNEQHSGAYVFRPDSKKTYPVTGAVGDDDEPGSLPEVTMVDLQAENSGNAATISRVAFKIGSWVTVEYRVNDGDEFLEIEWTVGSIPIKDKVGKEVIIRFDTAKNIQSASTFYTDSNGMEFMTRVLNHRDTWNLTLHDDQEFVAANYFPMTTGSYIKDSKHQLNILTDRAQGVASLEDGQVEVMVHRRLLSDDGKGVGEPLNETESVYVSSTKKHVTKGLVVRGNFFINVDTAEDGMKSMRSKMESTFFRPLTAYRKPAHSESANVETKLPWLTVNEFPPNVGLTTVQELSKKCLMMRLSHLYAIDEHATLSKPATVDFAKLFTVKNAAVSEVMELILTGTKPIATKNPNGLEWKTTDDTNGSAPRSLPVKGTSVVMQPIEVRAFRVCFEKSTEASSLFEADPDTDAEFDVATTLSSDNWDEADEEFEAAMIELDEVMAME